MGVAAAGAELVGLEAIASVAIFWADAGSGTNKKDPIRTANDAVEMQPTILNFIRSLLLASNSCFRTARTNYCG
jgi:hypothetical protein